MPKAQIASVSVRYDLSGHGDPTVLLHGSLVDRRTWDGVRPGLSQALRVLAYDRRGYGETTGPPRRAPVRNDAEDLAGLLHALDLFPVHLVAHSYAGAVALRLAADRPEMVRSLAFHEPLFLGVLEDDPATAPEAERLWEGMRRMQDLARSGHPDTAVREAMESLSTEEGAWDRLSPGVQQALMGHVDRWVEEMSDPEATRPDPSVLRELLIPVLLTTGERSPPFLRRITASLAGRLRNASTQTLPGVGHVPHLTDPNLYIAAIYGFLVERNVPFT
ncbi:MAG TPA: alpha/beta hydrolase [Thermoplasmata archaeon]|jgi:pimeloyl-ACP methyl ester carboxylesterase|nr:alpha/beta hydrolase [Thermoplasmata archaeon]